MPDRPKPRGRARAGPSTASADAGPGTCLYTLQSASGSTATNIAPISTGAIAVEDDDDDDLFAHRRRMIRKLASQAAANPPTPPAVLPAAGSGSEQEESGGKKRKRVKGGEPSWVPTGLNLASGTAIESEGDKVEAEDPATDVEVPVRAGSTTSSKTDSPLSPLPEHKLPVTVTTRVDSDEDDDEEDDTLPALDPVLMAKIQARHLTAKALSGSDIRFEGGSSVGKKCQVMVQPRMNPKKAETMGQKEKQSWGMRKAFDAPRGEPLTPIYETLGQVLGISNPSSNIIMELENGTRIWSCYATPDSLNFPDPEAAVVVYERSYYEQVEAERRETERLRFEGRLAADNEEPPSLPAPPPSSVQARRTAPESLAVGVSAWPASMPGNTQPIEIDSDSEPETGGGAAIASAGAGYSSDIEILDLPPRQPVVVPAPQHRDTAGSEPPVTPSSIPIQIRGKEGELSGSVSATTTFNAVIKYYAGKMSIPVELPAKGKGKKRVAGKRLKIDFDGDLFDGEGKILDLDLDGGETLDVKYV